MNKYERIDEFLKYLRDLIVQDPIKYSSSNEIYRKLTGLGITSGNRESIDNNFNKWISRYKNSDNIKVFVDEDQKYFCRFTNDDEECERYDNHLKLYVPLDREHIGDGAEIIFDFLEQNNIKHHSKIACKVRFDDIVIRMFNENDLIKTLEFIKNNKYIQEGLLPPNPFAFNKDGLALACDGSISYNKTVAKYIFLYMTEKRKSNNLDDVSVFDFYNFVQKYFNNNFRNFNEEKVYHDFKEDDYKDLAEVSYLIINSSDPRFMFGNYLDHFENVLVYKPKSKVKEINNNDIEEMTKFVISVMIDKYGSYEDAKNNIVDFIRTGDTLRLTRNSNLRSIIASNGYREKLIDYLSGINENIPSYIDYVYNKKILNKKQEENISDEQEISIDKESILKNAIEETYDKHGIEQAAKALFYLINSSNYKYFDNENKAMEYLINNVSPQEVKDIVISALGLTENIQYISDYQSYDYCSLIISKKRNK